MGETFGGDLADAADTAEAHLVGLLLVELVLLEDLLLVFRLFSGFGGFVYCISSSVLLGIIGICTITIIHTDTKLITTHLLIPKHKLLILQCTLLLPLLLHRKCRRRLVQMSS